LEDIIFFDDEVKNRNVEKELGVFTYIVDDGLSAEALELAVEEWRRRRGFGD
jgi:magnesium-dependent phosphatase 1